jgi:hypothetical protein
MKEKILALLVAAFQGVRKDGLNQLANALALQVTTEEEANSVVGKLTADQVNNFVNDWRKEADAEITKANKTYEDGLKKKYDFTEKKTEEIPPVQVPSGTLDAAAIQNIVTEAVKAATTPLLEKVATLEGRAITANRRELLVKELADVPESYKNKVLKDFDRMTFKDEDGFNEYLNDTKTDVASFGQELADKGLGQQGKPFFGTVNQDGVSAGVQTYIKDKTDEGKSLGGKEV